MIVLNCEQMKYAEKSANDNGLSYLEMMENAGRGCYGKIRENMSDSARKVCILCGKGNNGGDGLVVSRLFSLGGFDVSVVLACGEPVGDSAVEVYKKLDGSGCKVIDFKKDGSEAFDEIESSDVIVDAVFGTGFSGDVGGKIKELFEYVNSLKDKRVFAIDVPSGISGDSGEAGGTVIKADFTAAVCALKPCHVFYPAREFCGRIETVDIGIGEDIIELAANGDFYTLSFDEIKEKFNPRPSVSNKGDYGKVLEICGSKQMPGAAVLCAKGVLRSGAGLLKIVFPEDAYSAIASQVAEATFYPVKGDKSGFFDGADSDRIIKNFDWADVVVIGCGIGTGEAAFGIVREVIKNSSAPVVVDADGINALEKNIDILCEAKAPIVLTPHPGEMSRLTGKTVGEIQKNRISAAKDFAEEYGVTVVLKGSNTVVAVPGEKSVFVNTTGNPGMATGGSGDLLAGITAGFLAQKMSCKDAAVCAVFVHGAAGDAASAELSKMACLPGDVAEKLPEILLETER